MKFLDKTSKKSSKIERLNITIEFYIFEIVCAPNFSLNWQFWIFGTNEPKMDTSDLKQKKNENHWRILNIQISVCSKFQLQQIILIFWNKFPKKRILPVKNEHHHWILHTQISLRTKLNQMFITNLPKKGISGWKQKRWTAPWTFTFSNWSKHQVSA